MDRRAFLRHLGLGAAVVAAEPVRRYWQVGAVLVPAPTPVASLAAQFMGAMNEMGAAAGAALNRAVLADPGRIIVPAGFHSSSFVLARPDIQYSGLTAPPRVELTPNIPGVSARVCPETGQVQIRDVRGSDSITIENLTLEVS